MSTLQQFTPYLKELRLAGMLAGLEARIEQASGEQWGYEEFLTRLFQEEVERRRQKQLDLTLRRGNVTSTKTLESFDFAFNPSINRRQILDLAAGAYLRQHRNVLICGQTGVGKSHLAHALAHEAARQGASVLCTSAHQMLVHVNAGRADGTYAKRMATYLRPSLLVIDDFGLKPLPRPLRVGAARSTSTTWSMSATSGAASSSPPIVPQPSCRHYSVILCSPMPPWIAWPTTPWSSRSRAAASV
jgi:DNA replication protein DnaC